MKKIVSVMALVALFAFTAPKEHTFHYKFVKGETYELKQNSKMTQHIMVAGQDQNIESTIKGNMVFKIISLNGTSAVFEAEYSSMALMMKMPQMTIDSEGDTSKPMNKLMGKMINLIAGKKFNFTLSKSGNVESIENTDNLWSGFSSTDAMMSQFKSQMEQSFGKTAVKKSIEDVFVSYPDHKIKEGETWKRNSTTGSSIQMDVAYDISLQSITEPTATIISDGRIFTPDTTKTFTLQGSMKATSALKGRQVTRTTVSTTTAWPEKASIYSEIKGKMMLLAGGQIPEDMPMQMEMTAESEYTLTKK